MFHTVILVGHLGRDPEMRYVPSGDAVTSFSMAIQDGTKAAQDGTKVEKTIWVKITAWGKTGENCNQYLRKGSKVLVEGKITGYDDHGNPRIWSGQDGTAHASFEVKANTVRFLSTKAESEALATQAPVENAVAAELQSPPDDDVPF
jgi:single-strand DNA-binding protein